MNAISKAKRDRRSKSKSLPRKTRFAKDTLVAQKNILQGIMENAGVMLAYLDREFNFVAVSSAYAKGSGHKIEELVGKNYFEIFSNKENQSLFEKVRDTGETVSFFDKSSEFADQPERGITYWDWTLAPVKDQGGRVQGLILSLFETTHRKRAEEEIRVLSRFPAENPNPVMRISKDGTILYCNEAGSPMLNEWKCQIGQRAPSSWSELVADAFKSGTKKEFEEEWGTRTFSFMLAPIAAASYVNVYGQDITKRKMAKKALRESEIDLNRAQAVAKTGSWRLDVRRDELLWSDETYRMFGIPEGTPLTYETFLRSVHPSDQAYVDEKWKAALRGEPYDIEHRIVVDGEVKWVREKAELEFDKDKTLLGGFGTVQEITERKRMEQDLRDSLNEARRRESEISALLAASKAVLQHRQFQNAARLIFDSCKGLLGATAGYVALLSEDETKNEVLFVDSGGLPCTVDPSLPMPIRGLRAEAHRTGKAVYHNDFPNSEWTKLMPEGHMTLKNALFAPLVVNNKTVGLIGVANKPEGFNERDARMALAFGEFASIALINSQNLESLEENQKRLKEYSQHLEDMVEERTKKLQDAQRLATIGETAGMVGHDIRNPLQSIEGAVYLAKEELKLLPAESQEKKELTEILEIIEHQANYIDHIVADLQDFARTPIPQPKETDIQELITESLSMLEIPGNIQVDTAFQENLPRLNVDPVYIKRVVVNLIENAVQAMPKGGNLAINLFSDEESTHICVKDTGVGIPEKDKTKAFAPLFSTKAKGLGFGLAVCKKLVEAHNGEITFESKPGNTTFKIKVPHSRKVN